MLNHIKYILSVIWRELKENWYTEFEFPETERVKKAEERAELKLRATVAICRWLALYPKHRMVIKEDLFYSASYLWEKNGRLCGVAIDQKPGIPAGKMIQLYRGRGKGKVGRWEIPWDTSIILYSYRENGKNICDVHSLRIKFSPEHLIKEETEGEEMKTLEIDDGVLSLAQYNRWSYY